MDENHPNGIWYGMVIVYLTQHIYKYTHLNLLHN